MPTSIISVSHLRKSYRSTVAVDDVSLEVHRGEIFGLIGPNGAGQAEADYVRCRVLPTTPCDVSIQLPALSAPGRRGSEYP